jgi:hypothetical protein
MISSFTIMLQRLNDVCDMSADQFCGTDRRWTAKDGLLSLITFGLFWSNIPISNFYLVSIYFFRIDSSILMSIQFCYGKSKLRSTYETTVDLTFYFIEFLWIGQFYLSNAGTLRQRDEAGFAGNFHLADLFSFVQSIFWSMKFRQRHEFILSCTCYIISAVWDDFDSFILSLWRNKFR